MPFPIYPDKCRDPKNQRHAITPQKYLDYRKQEDRPLPDLSRARGVILGFNDFREFYRYDYPHVAVRHLKNADILTIGDAKLLAVTVSGIGAPAAVTVLEELIAMGAKRFVCMGTAGALGRAGLRHGELALCSRAFRDEGTSRHYLPESDAIEAHQGMFDRLRFAFERQALPCRECATWTTDTPYRETVDEVEYFVGLGAFTVEMEASALMAVAQYRDVELGCAFSVSDMLVGEDWQPRFKAWEVESGLAKLFSVSVNALLA